MVVRFSGHNPHEHSVSSSLHSTTLPRFASTNLRGVTPPRRHLTHWSSWMQSNGLGLSSVCEWGQTMTTLFFWVDICKQPSLMNNKRHFKLPDDTWPTQHILQHISCTLNFNETSLWKKMYNPGLKCSEICTLKPDFWCAVSWNLYAFGVALLLELATVYVKSYKHNTGSQAGVKRTASLYKCYSAVTPPHVQAREHTAEKT